ncbi:MEDS domain-containing protein [Caenimonas aquaedulcis]|uniref:MEDS domain-containing protein n=1 Tax=Caenimonas aquaedulcis TaxID=2793270 RepID=A0A931H4S5_9BURK|nr:MEDS domain-containing protein [Caenimonas aquaedulcis]MBG9388626.1 MEDS domain-containing protein [Caenimonas aquaedulcis]
MTSPALPFRDSVRFYDQDAQLVSMLVDYVGPALREGRHAFVIARPGIAHAVSVRLHREYLRGGAAVGVLSLIDARSTLDQVLVEGWPDAAAFDRHVGSLVRMAAAEGRPAVAFGEMVSLLWDDGKPEAALRLEALWNDLQNQGAFSLMCAYPARLFNHVEGDAPYAPVLGRQREALAA